MLHVLRPGERQVFWVHREPDYGDPINNSLQWYTLTVGRGPVRSHGGLLLEAKLPSDAKPVPSDHAHIQRLRLATGNTVVARQRSCDPDGPWALSVGLARDEEHRRRLEALAAQDGADEVRAVVRQREEALDLTTEFLCSRAQREGIGPLPDNSWSLWRSAVCGWSTNQVREAGDWGRGWDDQEPPAHVAALAFWSWSWLVPTAGVITETGWQDGTEVGAL